MATITVLQGWDSAEIIERNFSNLTAEAKVEFADEINKEIYYLTAANDPSRITSLVSTSVNEGLNTIALPAGFDTVASHNLGIYKQNDDGSDNEESLALIARGSRLEGYRIEGSNFIINSASSQTFNIYYIPEVATMTQTNLLDIFFVTDKYREMIKFGLLFKWAEFNRNTIIENNYAVKYETLKADYLDSISRTSNVFGMPDTQY